MAGIEIPNGRQRNIVWRAKRYQTKRSAIFNGELADSQRQASVTIVTKDNAFFAPQREAKIYRTYYYYNKSIYYYYMIFLLLLIIYIY